MPTTRRRPETEFEATQQNRGTQTLTLSSLTGGYNGYTNPELMSPQFWAAASNIYSGLHGALRRARWAPIENATSLSANNTFFPYANGTRITDIFGVTPTGFPYPFIIVVNGNTGTSVLDDRPISYFYMGGHGSPLDLNGVTVPKANLLGPYMWLTSTPALLFMTNGKVRAKYLMMANGLSS